MDKLKKEVTIDFERYAKENQDTFIKGAKHGKDYAIKMLTVYLNGKRRALEYIKNIYYSYKEIDLSWKGFLVSLNREEEWIEIERYIKEEEEKEKQEN